MDNDYEYDAVKKFNSSSEENKMLEICNLALMHAQSSLFSLIENIENDEKLKQATKEYQYYLMALIKYIAPKIGQDPSCLYPRETT